MHYAIIPPGQFPCDVCGKSKNSLRFLKEHKLSVYRIKADGTLDTTPKRARSTSTTKRKNRPAIVVNGKHKCHYCDERNN